jgi:hypothetical protein
MRQTRGVAQGDIVKWLGLWWIGAFLSLASVTPAHADESGWERDISEAGIVVSVKSEPGRNLPVFKGVGTIDAGVYEVLAILDDAAHYTDWMANCASARIIKKISDFDRYEYNRTSAPWPVSDRDAVVHTTVEGSAEKREVWARFESIRMPGQGPIDGVVRMPRLRGFYHLQAIDDTHTRVTYQVDADPGGMLPDWLVKRASRRLPIDTIVGMRKQVKQTRGRYDAFLARYDPAHGGKIPEGFQK